MSRLEYYAQIGVNPIDKLGEAQEVLEATRAKRDGFVYSFLKQLVLSVAFLTLALAYLRANKSLSTSLMYILIALPLVLLASLINRIGPLQVLNKQAKEARDDLRYWHTENWKCVEERRKMNEETD